MKIWFFAHKRLLQVGAGMIAVVLLVLLWMALHPEVSPVPAAIKQEVNFPVIYPKGYNIDPGGWQYIKDNKSLEFTAKKGGDSVVFNEQAVPLAYQNDAAAYNRFIGSLRPSATFDSPLGSVSLATFVTAADFQDVGQSGILNTHGTLLIAHPGSNFSDDQWRSLFNSLKVDK